jgi:HSP20 family protein
MTRLEIQRSMPPREVIATPRAVGADFVSPFAGGIDGSFAPSFEVQEHARHFLVFVDLPGVAPRDVTIFVQGAWLTICGRRTQQSTAPEYRAFERTFGAFWRAFRLLPGITAEGSRASLERGVLKVHVPKRDAPS